MKHDVEARLAALEEALLLRKMEQEAPVDDLSRSLFEMGRELAGLDEQGKAELLQSLNKNGLNLSQDAFEQFVTEYRKEKI